MAVGWFQSGNGGEKNIEEVIGVRTMVEKIEKVSPMERFVVLARELDRLGESLSRQDEGWSVDELLEVLEIDELAEQFGISAELMRKKLKAAGGKVVKIGRKHVIRKVSFLEVLQSLEEAE